MRYHAKPATPKPLPVELARALVSSAGRFFELAPWTFMSDLHLVGVRDGSSAPVRIASVLGNRREVFGVNFYRGPAGLAWIHGVATEGDSKWLGSDSFLRGFDCVKVEWTEREELVEADLRTLADGGFEPARRGRGPVWPRFQSAVPGWYPWFVSAEEARQLASDLDKVFRLASLFRGSPDLFASRTPDIPIVPEGTGSLSGAEIDWISLAPPPARRPSPLVLPEMDLDKLRELPLRKNLVFDCAVELIPELRLLDETTKRPQMGQVALMADGRSGQAFGVHVTSPDVPLCDAVQKTIRQGLLDAGVRPGRLQVESEDLRFVLESICAEFGVKVRQVENLPAARASLESLTEFIADHDAPA